MMSYSISPSDYLREQIVYNRKNVSIFPLLTAKAILESLTSCHWNIYRLSGKLWVGLRGKRLKLRVLPHVPRDILLLYRTLEGSGNPTVNVIRLL